jgi:hypothetical protein
MQASEIPVQYMPHHDSPLQRRGSGEFSPPPNNEISPRKRTYSSISGEFSTPYQPQRPSVGSWPTQETPRHLPHPSSAFATPPTAPAAPHVFREPNYSPNGLQPLPQWRNAPEPPPRQNSSFDSISQAEHGHSDHAVEWDEGVVDRYVYKIGAFLEIHLCLYLPATTSLYTPHILFCLSLRLESIPGFRTAHHL